MGFLPAISTGTRTLLVRGGAIASSTSTSITPGGAATATAATTSFTNLLHPTSIPHHKSLAVFYMALSMSLHFFGYEFARSATLTLFTSKSTGFSSASSLPLALACVCPASLTLLYVYTAALDKFGPRLALRYTSIMCSLVLVGLSALIKSNGKLFPAKWGKYVVGILFVFREAYVQLLSTQHWSFMGSVLTKREGARW